MKLTYWIAKCVNDSDCYSIRTKTKKGALKRIESADWQIFEPPIKVYIEYDSAYDLLQECTCEDRLWWEADSSV